MQQLIHKTAIVTGASKGIGAAIAKHIAKEGANVIVNYASDHKGAEAVVHEILANGGQAHSIQADLTKQEDVQRLFSETQKKYGSLDILVNNVGIYKFEPIETVTEQEFHRQFNSNVLSVILSIQESLKYFGDKGGSIINISSVASVKATAGAMVYSASKSAVDAVTKTMAKELGNRKIRVNSILPGPTHTDGNKIAGTDIEKYIVANTSLGRIGHVDDTAHLTVFLATDQSSWITGQQIGVSGGFDL